MKEVSEEEERFNKLVEELKEAELTQTNYFYLRNCIKDCK